MTNGAMTISEKTLVLGRLPIWLCHAQYPAAVFEDRSLRPRPKRNTRQFNNSRGKQKCG